MGVSWSTPADLTVINDDASKPQVTIDSSGRAIALWEGLVGGRLVVLTKSSLDGGLNWSAATDLSGTDGGNVYKQRLSIDGSGRAIAIWGRGGNIQSSSSSDGGASWSPLVTLSSTGGSAEAPEVSIDASGRAIAIWSRYPDGGPKSTIQSSSSLDGGLTWSPAKDVSSSEFDAYDPEVSIDGSGRAIAVWESERYVPGQLLVSIMQASVSTDGGLTWSPVVDLSTADDYASFAQLNANSSGRVFVVWELYDNLTGEDVVQTRSYLFPAALADTGANDSVIGASAAASAGLFAAGALALAIRRRLARS
jgi:type IV secretory pathway protease TraF